MNWKSLKVKIPKFSEFSQKARISVFLTATGLVFALFFYYTIVSFSGLHGNFFELLRSLIYNQDSSIWLAQQLILSLKTLNVILASLLTLFFFSLFSSGLSFLFYSILAKKHDYNYINPLKSLKKVVEWQLYRYSITFAPLLGFFFISGLLFFLGTAFFNLIVMMVGVNTGIVSFISSFIGFNMMFLFAFSGLITLWCLMSFCFGAEIAVSEPELDNKTIALRSKRLAFAVPENYILFAIYALFGILLVMQLKMVDVLNFRNFEAFFVFNILSFAGLKYLKTSAYINSLLTHHERASQSSHCEA